MKRAAASSLALLALITAGCSHAQSPAQSPASRARAGGGVGLAEPPTVPPSRRTTLRLGYTPSMPDAIALAGIGCGYFQQNLGPGTTLDAIAYSSSAAEAAAFAHGQLDAAYINPVAAVGAWQATRGQIRIIAGAASSADGTDTQYARTVLAVTTRLMAQSATLQKLLAGDIQAEILLATKPVTALHSLQAQLARVGKKTTARQLLTALAQLHVTSNPLASTIATEASRAATAGILRPIRDLADIYDLAALNALLKNVGQAPVSLDG